MQKEGERMAEETMHFSCVSGYIQSDHRRFCGVLALHFQKTSIATSPPPFLFCHHQPPPPFPPLTLVLTLSRLFLHLLQLQVWFRPSKRHKHHLNHPITSHLVHCSVYNLTVDIRHPFSHSLVAHNVSGAYATISALWCRRIGAQEFSTPLAALARHSSHTFTTRPLINLEGIHSIYDGNN